MDPHSILKQYFGYDNFRPLQEEIISHVLLGKDTLVLMPTGGGKSLCYQIPALVQEGLTLVISPLIALMKDQVDALVANGVSAAFINSSLSQPEIARILASVRAGRIKILYLAPERLAVPGFLNFLKETDISLIAIDEAHCISEWGHDFRPEYRNLKMLRVNFPRIPIIALTATATERVRVDMLTQLNLASARIFLSSFNRPNLTYAVHPKSDAFAILVQTLKKYRGKPAIIYRFSRGDTEKLAAKLSRVGVPAQPYHAGLSPDKRRETQEKFIRDDVPVIVATIAFGMGIDKPDVRLVVHYDLPKSVEGYYQETGRAGRDGLPSECLLFYSYGDMARHYRFINEVSDPQEKKRTEEKLKQIVSYAELSGCRRKFLLSYFGESAGSNCGSCDNCTGTSETADATLISQKIMSAIARTGERYGGGYIADVLTGKRDDKITARGHEKLSVYGIAADFKKNQIARIINALCTQGLLVRRGEEYPSYALTAEGKETLKNRAPISLSKHVMMRPKKESLVLNASDGPILNPMLFDALRALRKQLADERGVPPYVIFGDRTLKEMCQELPRNEEELSAIFGVGSQKLEQFGDMFLELIRLYSA